MNEGRRIHAGRHCKTAQRKLRKQMRRSAKLRPAPLWFASSAMERKPQRLRLGFFLEPPDLAGFAGFLGGGGAFAPLAGAAPAAGGGVPFPAAAGWPASAGFAPGTGLAPGAGLPPLAGGTASVPFFSSVSFFLGSGLMPARLRRMRS